MFNKEKNKMNELLIYILQKLRYTKHEHLFQSVENLNKMPDRFIKDASQLDPEDAEVFFRYIVTPENKRFLASYVEAVVFKGEPTEKYGLKKYFVPDASLNHQLTLNREQMLHFSKGKFNMIQVINYNSWKNAANSMGIPMVPTFGANYLTPTPKGAYSIGETNHTILGTPQSIDIAYRRWIAQRAAMPLFRKVNTELSECIGVLNKYAPQETWTQDAVIAIRALLRERQELGQREGEIPGFIGPDEWYE
jgi:hypothetical protein